MRPELDRWLQRATRPLPAELALDIREELAAHYDEAYNAYLLAGRHPDDAHTAALNDLGDPRLTASGLRHTHRPVSLYRRAALASIAAPLMLLPSLLIVLLVDTSTVGPLLGVMINAAWGVMLAGLSTIGMWLALDALDTLTGYHVDLRLPRNLIVAGLLATVPFIVLGAFGRLDPAPTPEVFVIIDPLTVFNTLYSTLPISWIARLQATILGGVVGLVGIGWMLVAVRLGNGDDPLYSLGGPLRGLCLASGLTLLGTAVGTILWDTGLTALMAGFGCVLAGVKAAALTLLFYRASVDATSSSPLRWE